MDESQCSVPSERSRLLNNSTSMTFWKRQNYRKKKQIIGYQELGWVGGFDYKVVAGGTFGGDGTALCLHCGGEFVKIHVCTPTSEFI